MLYNIYYEVASLFFLAIIYIYHKILYKNKSVINKKFSKMVLVCFLAVFLDSFTAVLISYHSFVPIPLNTVASCLYFIFMTYSSYYFSQYISVAVGCRQNKFMKAFNISVILVFVLMEILNLFYGFFFYFDPKDGYVHGSLYLIQIFLDYYYIVYSWIIIMLKHDYKEKKDAFVVHLYIGVCGICIAVQVFLVPNTLLTGFATALTVFIIFLGLESPDYEKLLTTMKELEIAKAEADKANKVKSQFLANMSHEIRTPLNCILGINEIMIRDNKDDEMNKYLSDVKYAGQSLLNLINDILDVSRIEAGKMDIVNNNYEVYSLIHGIVNVTRYKAHEKNLDFYLENDPGLPSILYGDDKRINQVAVNFLTNAIKYTNTGSVSVKFIYEEKEDGIFNLIIKVKDTGIGIKTEDQAKLFDAFERFDLKENRTVEGTGLGLKITKELLHLMGGNIMYDSEYGKGSTFVAIIPQVVVDRSPMGEYKLDEAAPMAKSLMDLEYKAENKKILVVDDVEMNLVVMEGLLKTTGADITLAASGAECLKKACQDRFDIIFLDHMMPEMDGIETFKAMKALENNPNKATPVICLTANAISGAKEEYLEIGFNDYLSKPIEPEKLFDLLKKYKI